MAADCYEELRLSLLEADKTYKMTLYLTPYETGATISVRHLAEEIEKQTNIKKSNQRIIFNGMELCDPNCTLSLLGIRNDCQIHVLKKEYDPDVVKPGYKIDLLEKRVREQDKHLNCLIHQFDVMQKDLVPCLCSCENVVELLNNACECQRTYQELEEKLNAIETDEDCLVKRKEILICRIKAKLRCNENMIIGANDVLVRMSF